MAHHGGLIREPALIEGELRVPGATPFSEWLLQRAATTPAANASKHSHVAEGYEPGGPTLRVANWHVHFGYPTYQHSAIAMGDNRELTTWKS